MIGSSFGGEAGSPTSTRLHNLHSPISTDHTRCRRFVSHHVVPILLGFPHLHPSSAPTTPFAALPYFRIHLSLSHRTSCHSHPPYIPCCGIFSSRLFPSRYPLTHPHPCNYFSIGILILFFIPIFVIISHLEDQIF